MEKKTDLVPELLETVNKEFDSKSAQSKVLKEAFKKLAAKKADYNTANEFAIEVGQLLSSSLGNNVTAQTLPNGKMYYNIAERLMGDTLKKNYDLITGYTTDVQKLLNEEVGISIEALVPEFNQERLDGLVQKMADSEEFDMVKWLIKEPIVNFSQSIVDDAIEKNIGFQYKAGMSPKLVRILVGHACGWCKERAGVFNYPEVPDGVFQRHERCRCTVNYYPSRMKGSKGKIKDVWTKVEKDVVTNDNEEEKLERLKKVAFKTEGPQKFAQTLTKAKKTLDAKDAWRVDVHDALDYKGDILRVTPKGSTVAVTKEGDIISVCRTKNDTARGSDLLKEAVKKGGTKLDSYQANHMFYTKNGFEPVSWCKWDDAFKPDGWTEDFDRENIIFYKYTGKQPDKLETASEFFKRVDESEDYGAAQEIRDSSLTVKGEKKK